MKKYKIERLDGGFSYASYIGVNHTANDMYFVHVASSFDGIFDNNDIVNIKSSTFDVRYCMIGNIKEAYEILKNKLKEKKLDNFSNCMVCVFETIIEYFGDYRNIKERMDYYPDCDDVAVKDYGRVSDLAHKNAAMCVERAMVSQNLLKSMGYNSIFKLSGVVINGKNDAHAYNLIQVDNKYYIFDATIPTMNENMISPIICEIPKETFDKIKSPSCHIGESVHIIHYNPLQDKYFDIIYDAKRKEILEIENSFTKIR